MAWEAHSGLKLEPEERLVEPLLGLNGLGSPFEGRKYSVSRIGEEAAVCVEWALLSLILAGDLPSVGLKEEYCRWSERRISGRKGSGRQAQAALTLGRVRGRPRADL